MSEMLFVSTNTHVFPLLEKQIHYSVRVRLAEDTWGKSNRILLDNLETLIKEEIRGDEKA